MATEDADGYGDHFRSITVTAIAAISGIVAALVSVYITAGAESVEAAAKNQNAQLAVLGLVMMQPLLLKALGLLKDDFGLKDVLFIAFMTFSLWFITYGILLTTGVAPLTIAVPGLAGV